eukprot:243867_1
MANDIAREIINQSHQLFDRPSRAAILIKSSGFYQCNVMALTSPIVKGKEMININFDYDNPDSSSNSLQYDVKKNLESVVRIVEQLLSQVVHFRASLYSLNEEGHLSEKALLCWSLASSDKEKCMTTEIKHILMALSAE